MTSLKVNRDYEVLPQEFMGRGSQFGWVFKQLKRIGDIALYSKTDNDGNQYYEVVVIGFSKGGSTTIGGVNIVFNPKELYPSNEQFGVNGWCFSSQRNAESRFEQILLATLHSQ